MSVIEVKNIEKVYRIVIKEKGVWNSFKGLIRRRYKEKKAVDGISFQIEPGEIVGFIGKNGAGKSTTIKMLSGILYPNKGSILVDGFIPYKQRKKYVANIGVVFGQKTQLNWDLPLIESFELQKYIYKIPNKTYEENLKKFVELLDMKEFINQPVRQLSLGQRMRGDIAAALLHSPKIVFFDEPTIGLDVVAKEKIREFIKYLNETEGITMIFTTHDMQDIEKVCKRLIIIDGGKKIYDGTVEDIKNQHISNKSLEVEFEEKNPDISRIKYLHEIKIENISKGENVKKRFTFDVSQCPMNEVMEDLFQQFTIKDIAICEPEIDTIIRDIYEGGI